MSNNEDLFKKLSAIDVNDKVELKQKQKYLSWTYAWAEFKKECPTATYEPVRHENGALYFADEFGITVETIVTVGEESHRMWLPVLDGAGNAMKKESYTYEVQKWENGRKVTGQYVNKIVQAATTFDINKALMRCLVKNIGMFGLGLYIYAGEDMPDVLTIDSDQMSQITKFATEHKFDLALLNKQFGTRTVKELYACNFESAMAWLNEQVNK